MSTTKQRHFTEENAMHAAAIAEAESQAESPLAVVQPSPLSMLQQAINNPEVDPDRLEKFMELYERWEKREAEKAYNAAKCACQAEMKPIERNAWNSQTESHYLNIENLHAQLKPIWLKHGFSVSAGSESSPLPNHYRVVIDLSHSAGHSTKHYLDGPCDDKGMKGTPNKTPIQGVVSTMTYLERKLTCMVWNVTLANQDKDGNGGVGQPLAEHQLDELDKLLIRVVEKHGEQARQNFYRFMKIDSLMNCVQSDYLKAKAALDAKMRQAART